MFPPLPTKRAHLYLKKIFERLQNGSLVLKQVSLPSEERDGHGVMIGCLVCADAEGNKIILNAVSGNSLVAEGESEGIWVPPIVSAELITDALLPNDKRIHELTAELKSAPENERRRIAAEREILTTESLRKVHELYRFHCIDGSVRRLTDICKTKLPPTGTGDCCAPKLLDYAFSHSLFPVSMDEMYWGKATQSKESGTSYPPCDERCALVLPSMLGLEIVYRDDAILVVNKPSGLLSVPGRGPEKQDCIVNRMKRLFPKTIPYPSVHRLDMETSGLMVLAFTQDAQRSLSMQFEKGDVHKRYIALLDGSLENAPGRCAPLPSVGEGCMELKFSLDWPNRPKRIYDEANGKLGITEWKKLGYNRYRGTDGKNRKVTRILFIPHTGRTHQLRVASSDMHGFGLPIVGDSLYGRCGAGERLMLHASYLSFIHPVRGGRVAFECEPDF